MKKTITILVVLCIIFIIIVINKREVEDASLVPVSETMPLTLFLQDKEIARTSDCSVTYKTIRKIPKTTAVLDASLKILFEEELSQYGEYDFVKIKDKVAEVMLKDSLTKNGTPIDSISSCEVGHLTSVLHDTLTQYPEVVSVQLFSPEGKIEF